VNFKVTGINFMTVYRAKEGGLLLARVTTIIPLYFPGNSTFYASFGMHQSDKLSNLKSRGREARQAGFGLLSGHRCGQVEGEA